MSKDLCMRRPKMLTASGGVCSKISFSAAFSREDTPEVIALEGKNLIKNKTVILPSDKDIVDALA